MDIQQLKLFRHLAGTLHFGRTSQECNITPSGLTRVVQRLEQQLGQPLFHRDRRSVSLTPAGETFRDYVEDSLQRWQELQNSLAGDQVLRGSLSLYCSVTALLALLPGIAAPFRRLYPQVHIHLQTGDAAQALHKLSNGEADIVIAALPEQQPEWLLATELVRTPLLFIGPRHYPETVIRDVAGIDWQHTPVILSARGLSRERSLRWFTARGVWPNIYSEVAGNEAMIAMVGLGYGVAVVPQLVLETSPLAGQVAVLPVTPELEPFLVGLCTSYKKYRHPAVAAFFDCASRQAASISV